MMFQPSKVAEDRVNPLYYDDIVHVSTLTDDAITLRGWLKQPLYMSIQDQSTRIKYLYGRSVRKTPPNPDEPLQFALYFHGNSGHLQHYEGHIGNWCDAGYWVMMFDYRGYGASQGSPTEHHFYPDVECMFRCAWNEALSIAANQRHSGGIEFTIVGYSLGSAAAVYCARLCEQTNRRIKALVIEAGFANIADAAKHSVPVTKMSPFDMLITKHFPSDEFANDIHQTPLVIVHSPNDEVCPYDGARKLFYEFKTPPEFKIFINSKLPQHMGVHSDHQVFRFLSNLPPRTMMDPIHEEQS
jgi:predicted alpha/beta hydrolase family esterase